MLGAQRHAPVGDTLSRYGRGGDPRAWLGCRGCEEEKGGSERRQPPAVHFYRGLCRDLARTRRFALFIAIYVGELNKAALRALRRGSE